MTRVTLCTSAPVLALALTFAVASSGFAQSAPPTGPSVPTLIRPAGDAAALAPDTGQEDLSGCPLPHGDVILPNPGTFEATNGDMLQFSSGMLRPYPMDEKRPIPEAKLPAAIQASHAGDLAYLDSDNGTLWAFSGRISEIGTYFLYEAAAMTTEKPFSRAMLLEGDGKMPAGMFKNIVEGRVYLVEGTDGKSALVRVIEKTPVGLHIQYVYQSNGTMQFVVPAAVIPRVAVVPLQSPPPPQQTALASAVAAGTMTSDFTLPAPGPGTPTPAAPVTPVPPAATPTINPARPAPPRSLAGLTLNMNDPLPAAAADSSTGHVDSSVDANLRQRDGLIRQAMNALQGHGSPDQKSQAMEELGALHAGEAADLLASQISFLDSRKKQGADDFAPETLHPAYAALLKLGRPSTEAALKALRGLNPADAGTPDNPMRSADYRGHLLANVIRSVEGDDVATFILQREASRTADPQKRAFIEQLAGKP